MANLVPQFSEIAKSGPLKNILKKSQLKSSKNQRVATKALGLHLGDLAVLVYGFSEVTKLVLD